MYKIKYKFNGVFFYIKCKDLRLSTYLNLSLKKNLIKLEDFYNEYNLNVEKCRICKESYPPIDFICRLEEDLLIIEDFKYKKDKIYCYKGNPNCTGIKMNSNSVEFVSKVLNMTEEDALMYIKSRNKSPFYKENWKNEEEYKNYQRRDTNFFKNKYGDNWELEYEKYKKSISYSNSLEGYCERYGNDEGEKLFQFVSSQKDSMSFNYFMNKNNNDVLKSKYEYENRIKSVSTNLESFINRYGEKDGKSKYKNRCESSSISSEKYFKSLSPEERKKKHGITIENLQRKYKDYDIAKSIYDKWLSSVLVPITRSSKESLLVFEKLYDTLYEFDIKYEDIYLGHGDRTEYFIRDGKNIFFYDFVIKSKKIIIEYNGIAFHPKLENLKSFRPILTNLSSEELFNKQKYKVELAERNGFKVLEIWSDEDNKVDKCIQFIKNNINNG